MLNAKGCDATDEDGSNVGGNIKRESLHSKEQCRLSRIVQKQGPVW
jgi:hypothetical protein